MLDYKEKSKIESIIQYIISHYVLPYSLAFLVFLHLIPAIINLITKNHLHNGQFITFDYVYKTQNIVCKNTGFFATKEILNMHV
jgi:hypothetical protein